MKVVRWTAFGCFGLAAFSVVLAIFAEAPAFLGAGVVVLVTGVGFFAAHIGLCLLADIRGALVLAPKEREAAIDVIGQAPEMPQPRSAAEIAADLAAMKLRA